MFGQKNIYTGWAIWLQWVLLSMSGQLAMIGLSRLLPANLDALLSGAALPIFQALWVLALGAGIAAAQWLVLRRYFAGAVRWIVTGSVGMLIGVMVAFPLKLYDLYVEPSGFQLDEVAYGVVFGFLMGSAQWLVMRTWVHRAGWWVLSSTIGWTLGMAVGEILPLNWNDSGAGFVYGMVTEGIPVAVTGLALVILVQNALDTTPIADKDAG